MVLSASYKQLSTFGFGSHHTVDRVLSELLDARLITGIRFFFEEVLDQKLPWINLIKAPKTQRLPDILTQHELARIIRATRDRPRKPVSSLTSIVPQ
jgi:hypothetical protein